MARKPLSRDTKHFVRWAQKDRCFLCSFHLVLHCHFHHIISVKDCGPDHYLNLIGLCANHHGMLENLKLTQSPSFSMIGTNHPKRLDWSYKSQAALAEFDALASEQKEAMNHLLDPYWQSNESPCGIFERHEPPPIKVALAKNVINRDIELLDRINSMRHRIFFQKPSIAMIGQNPYDILLMNQVEFQTTIDQVVNSNLHNIGNEKYDNVITLHLSNMGLPFCPPSHDNIIRFNFSKEISFSVQEIRKLSTDQIHSL